MNKTETVLLVVISFFNLLALILFYIDKIRAKKGLSRISEADLLLSAFLGGVGAIFGMKLFRHKTKHKLFKISVPIFAVLHLGLIAIIALS
ncbi:MAG: DUF1294 domain-containing protein [Oscillospiraceae bacterium]|nr:DUF1294 domain-containing protein [Oscillospiraceae bacterium]